MDFGFTEEQNRFRKEVQSFLDKELPESWIDYIGPTIDDTVVNTENGEEVFRDIAHKLGQKGWLSLCWPEEYGGQGASHVDYLIFLEEIAKRGSPGFNALGAKMVAPTLIDRGTKEQCEQHLGPIARGEEFWCEGFSEPEAGSDLAAVQTKARRDNNRFIINGQKTWSTFAGHSDWCCVLARTDPNTKKHKGLGFFLVDMSTPGITVSPINNIAGDPDFCEIYFDDVEVPVENMVGEENQGWEIAQTLLNHERAVIAHVAVAQTMVERLTKYLEEHPGNPCLQSYRQTLADLSVDAEIGRLLSYRIVWLQDKGAATAADAALGRLYPTTLLKRATTAALELLGPYGQLTRNEEKAPLQGWFNHLYLAAVGATVAAGTSEIQKTIIARELGLARS
ncbi:MAG: acyl-CoA dehydrogenase family protein [Dehalococcoidia bacterium]